jgi:hypothetical protein
MQQSKPLYATYPKTIKSLGDITLNTLYPKLKITTKQNQRIIIPDETHYGNRR